jgi:hypothetical protein
MTASLAAGPALNGVGGQQRHASSETPPGWPKRSRVKSESVTPLPTYHRFPPLDLQPADEDDAGAE